MHPLKTITSGEGGIISTNNYKISKNIKLYRSHGILRDKKKHWQYDVLKNGFNYRLSDINCALGLSQLSKINFFLKERKNFFNTYIENFKNISNLLTLPSYDKNIKPSFHLFLINIEFKKFKKNKTHFMEFLLKNKIISQQHYIPIYKFSVYNEMKNSFKDSNKYYENSVSIPIFVNLGYENQKKIINRIINYFSIIN